jgi:hypothetical protein
MLSNIKFKAIEDLKMTRAEEYDYDKFLSDSSDDYPKYEDGISQEKMDAVREKSDFSLIEGIIRQSTGNALESNSFVVKSADDWWEYKNSLGRDE